MAHHDLEAGKLYILSGIPGSGKSTFLSNCGARPEMRVSSDEIRRALLGSYPAARENGPPAERLWGWEFQNPAVFEMMRTAVRARLSEGLTTFVDSQALSESDRNAFAKIAKELGKETEVLIMDVPLEVALERNANRPAFVTESVIRRSFDALKKESDLPFRMIREGDTARIKAPELPWTDGKWDIVGDTHGLLEETKALLQKAGYSMENGFPEHPDGRRLLFLGDMVDRGPQSLEMVDFVDRAIRKGGHRALMGNHELKILTFFKRLEAGEWPEMRGLAPAETAAKLLRARGSDRKRLLDALAKLPVCMEMRAADGTLYGFAHADIEHFDPIATPATKLLRGTRALGSEFDTDGAYEAGFQAGWNRHILIRGHIPATSERDHVHSLDKKQAFAGELALLRLDRYHSLRAQAGGKEAYKGAIMTEKVKFDFGEHSKGRFALMTGLQSLKDRKLVSCKADDEFGLTVWKYSKKVFFDHLWGEDPLLLKARGLVLDLAGNIAQHPFDKVFNYGEEGAGLHIPEEETVEAIEKVNGFLGVIGSHPFKKGELLVSTTGSLKSPFVDMIRSFLTPELSGRMAKASEKDNVSFMFEVVHPEDPHIIQYGPESHGLWLIGARKREMGADLWSEDQLDDLAAELGLKRPKRELLSFGDAKRRVREDQTEGFMIRSRKTGAVEVKMKTTFYLTSKFISRMNEGNRKLMFANPKAFKEKVDEEFYPLVDLIVDQMTLEAFSSMPDHERAKHITGMIGEMWSKMETDALPKPRPALLAK